MLLYPDFAEGDRNESILQVKASVYRRTQSLRVLSGEAALSQPRVVAKKKAQGEAQWLQTKSNTALTARDTES